MEKKFVVPKDLNNFRLDKALSLLNTEYSRSGFRSLILKGRIFVNGNVVTKPSFKVKTDDLLLIKEILHKPFVLKATKLPLDICYEDDELLVVNKQRGLVVHEGAGKEEETLVSALLSHCKLSSLGGNLRPGIVHRIDKDTSGLLVVAKTNYSHLFLSKQFYMHNVERYYLAIVAGVIPEDGGVIDAPIGRDPKNRKRMAITASGKRAVTHFVVLKRFRNATFVRCKLETGRTHQIRVHFKYLGYPLIGDALYGSKNLSYPINGQALHAQTLGFLHPKKDRCIKVVTQIPLDMKKLIEFLSLEDSRLFRKDF